MQTLGSQFIKYIKISALECSYKNVFEMFQEINVWYIILRQHFFLQNYSFSGALSIMVEDQMKVHFKSSFICGTTSARIGICHKHLPKM